MRNVIRAEAHVNETMMCKISQEVRGARLGVGTDYLLAGVIRFEITVQPKDGEHSAHCIAGGLIGQIGRLSPGP